MKVQLSDRKVMQVVKELNKVLDDNQVIGQEWNKQVIKELIKQNLFRKTTIELIDELNKMPISEWND